MAALSEARAALSECLSALDGVESELEGASDAGREVGEVRGKKEREIGEGDGGIFLDPLFCSSFALLSSALLGRALLSLLPRA